MCPSISLPDFDVQNDCRSDDHALPTFMVSRDRGFLPRADPIVELPADFDVLVSILDRMPLVTKEGKPGLLARGELGKIVECELPNLINQVEKYQSDLPLMNALYRDYSFLASAYLLEPCDLEFRKTGSYGRGRDWLPCSIAQPLKFSADRIGMMPFMEYAASYALYNYKLTDPSKGLEYDNLNLIRAFEHGHDHNSSEAGFVLVHIAMVRHSGHLISAVMDALNSCGVDRETFNDNLRSIVAAYKSINVVMDTMWAKSKPDEYVNFRTFIMGIKSQPMFPNGVIYEGVSDEPFFFRGESGANDSMVPLGDNFLQISMPETPLTDILRDFRSYRPNNHKDFLTWTQYKAEIVGVKDYCYTDATSLGLYLLCLDQIREFRWRHWSFTREYILKKTKHPRATGGSPIVTWLPNQLQTVLSLMVDAISVLDGLGMKGKLGREVEAARETTCRQMEQLRREILKYCAEREDQTA